MMAGEVGMTEPDEHDGGDRLYYLDDLRVGQRFSSGEHSLDATQIKAFAVQYDPQPFHLDEEAARAGDVLRVESEVLEVTPSRSRPERRTITLRSETRNQRGEVVQVLTARLIVPRRALGEDVTPT